MCIEKKKKIMVMTFMMDELYTTQLEPIIGR